MKCLSGDFEKTANVKYLLQRLEKIQLKEALVKECTFSVEEETEQLIDELKCIKKDNEFLERQHAEMEESIKETLHKIQLIEEETEVLENSTENHYDTLKIKNNELIEFIDGFANKEGKEKQHIKEMETAISEVLLKISQKLQIQEQLPKENASRILANITADLTDRKDQVQVAEITMKRLNKELEDKKIELSKVDVLENRIETELSELHEKIDSMKQAIKLYGNINQLKKSIESQKIVLFQQKRELLSKNELFRNYILELTNSFETANRKLMANDVHAALSSQEQKLRILCQNSFSNDEYVRLKEKDCNYINFKADTIRLTKECNAIIKSNKKAESKVISGTQIITF